MDIITALLIAAGIFFVVCGKLAHRKGRSAAAWAIAGAIFMPFALIVLMMLPVLEPCPSCGKMMLIRPGRSCPHCGFTVPAPLARSAVKRSLLGTLGYGLGDSEAKIAKILDRRAIMFKRTPDDKIVYSDGEAFGVVADIEAELESGRTVLIRAQFPVDREYRIYYDMKAAIVAEFGRPDYENFDDGYTDNWHADDLLVSLSTASRGSEPLTQLIFQKLDPKVGKNISDALNR